MLESHFHWLIIHKKLQITTNIVIIVSGKIYVERYAKNTTKGIYYNI